MGLFLQDIVKPAPLRVGDKVAIVSPAGAVRHELFEPSLRLLRQQGWLPLLSEHADGREGAYSASEGDRLRDLRAAIINDDVKAIICGRGGYGCAQLLLHDGWEIIARHPKWLVGFSDVTVLHALWLRYGVASVHGPMLRGMAFAEGDGEKQDVAALFRILKGENLEIGFDTHTLNRCGVSDGVVVGGNMSILASLIGTEYDMLQPDTILFIEDVNEPLYKIERIMIQLRLIGVLPRLKGLIVGQFTGIDADTYRQDLHAMIARHVAPYGYPVAFDAPIGHSRRNAPIIQGSYARLSVTPAGCLVSQQ